MSKRRVKPTKGLGSVCSDPPSPYCKLSNGHFRGTESTTKAVKSFKGAREQACKKAGVPGLLLHNFRCTTVPEKAAMRISGHKTASLLWCYSIGRNLNPHLPCGEENFGCSKANEDGTL